MAVSEVRFNCIVNNALKQPFAPITALVRAECIRPYILALIAPSRTFEGVVEALTLVMSVKEELIIC